MQRPPQDHGLPRRVGRTEVTTPRRDRVVAVAVDRERQVPLASGRWRRSAPVPL